MKTAVCVRKPGPIADVAIRNGAPTVAVLTRRDESQSWRI